MARVLIPTSVFVHILVEEGGRYVLVQEAKPDIGCPWCFPGGTIEPGETPEQAIVRELCEELNVQAVPRRRLYTALMPDEAGVDYGIMPVGPVPKPRFQANS
jgi:8-oxo-dGTP pyrophosphatase MutT (NUDIX family)